MTRFIIAFVLVMVAVVTMLVLGGKPERRYESAACQYRMIYGYEPALPMGLVTVGGSRMRVSASARDFNPLLAELKPEAVPMHNLAHSYFTIEKEYVLLRDLAERQQFKTALVMIEDRENDFGTAHPDFVEIARLSDIPKTVAALWGESPLAAIQAVRGILYQHLRFFDLVGTPHKEMTDHDCDRLDYRLDVLTLDRAQRKMKALRKSELDWSISDPDQAGLRHWVDEIVDLSKEYDFQVMFVLITGTSEALPAPNVEQNFEDATGAALIVLDRDIHDQLALNGKRDSSHINAAGREVYLPWLIQRIDEKCTRRDGCF